MECSQATEGSECIGGVSGTAGASGHGGGTAAGWLRWLFSGATASSSAGAERKNDVAWEKSRANWLDSFGVFGVFGVFGSVR